MAKIVFRSCYRRYRAWFPPERFGTMETAELERGRYGEVVIDPDTQKPMRKRVPHPAAQFVDNMLELDDQDPMQAQMIDNLRRTIVTRTKEGALAPSELYEEDTSLTADINFSSGAVMVTVPEVLTDEDKEILWGSEKSPGLMTYFWNPLPEKAINSAFALLDRALARYEVRGIASPTQERAKKLLRPRIIDVVYALADAGLPLDLVGGRSGPPAEQAQAAVQAEAQA